MEIFHSCLSGHVNFKMNTNPKYGDVVMYENENVSETLKNLGEDDKVLLISVVWKKLKL